MVELLIACAGAIVLKALVLTAVERLYAASFGKMYSGWPETWQQVSSTAVTHCRHPASGALVRGHVLLSGSAILLSCVGASVPMFSPVGAGWVHGADSGGIRLPP
jgi:hypothetical protein